MGWHDEPEPAVYAPGERERELEAKPTVPQPDEPEAFARRLLGLAFADERGPGFSASAVDAIRTRDAALIAAHTAELTATSQRHREERDHYRGCYLEMVTTRDQWQDRIAHLEAQLAASAQREASARAEAREAALKEAFGVVVEAFQGESHERHPALFRVYCAIANKLIPAHQPAAGTEGSDHG